MHIGIHRYRTVLYSFTLYSTSSNNVDLLNSVIAVGLRNHQLHTELSLWRLIFLLLVFFVSRKFWNFFPISKSAWWKELRNRTLSQACKKSARARPSGAPRTSGRLLKMPVRKGKAMNDFLRTSHDVLGCMKKGSGSLLKIGRFEVSRCTAA